MIPFNVLTPTRYGTMLMNQHDVYVSGSLLRYGEFSEMEVAFLKPYLQPGNVVLDIGANIGALTIPFATLVGRSGYVFAFEPQRLCFQTLNANVALNSLTNVATYQYAVGHEGDSIRIPATDPYQRNNYGGVALSPNANGESVMLINLDEFNLPRAHLLKADCEGMEPEVLKGARRYITEHKPVLYLEADRPERKAELMGLLDELGYNAFAHSPPLYNPDNWRGDSHNVFAGKDADGNVAVIRSINLLAVPRGTPPPEGLERAM